MSKLNINPEKEPVPKSWLPTVITGGKEPPEDGECWLERLQTGAVFVAAPNDSMYGYRYKLIFKGSVFYLLTQYERNDTEYSLYIHPRMWCSIHRTYEVLGYDPPIEGEIQ